MTSAPPRILCVGTHHKTGTVWMRRVWREIGEALSIPFVPVHNPQNWTRIPAKGRVIVANWGARFAPALFDTPEARFLHVIRDPRDVLISGARYHEDAPGRSERFLHKARADLGGLTYQQHLRSLPSRDDKLRFEMGEMHQRTLTEMLDWPYGHPRAFDVTFETLMADTGCETFAAALEFFGFDAPEVEVAQKIFFKHALFGGFSDKNSDGTTDRRLNAHVAPGAKRGWRQVFSLEIAEEYSAGFGAALVRLGYESDARAWCDAIAPKTAIPEPAHMVQPPPLGLAMGGMA
ncbi:hypothetical protein [Tritonibacter mobilis]|uniref:hypothetical protein n=1 Tax=Tritonibacter mobilis TaxID=379347 RepID=UPI003A5BEB30